jgi:hypothetical protein
MVRFIDDESSRHDLNANSNQRIDTAPTGLVSPEDALNAD